jgi:hypothetical protein
MLHIAVWTTLWVQCPGLLAWKVTFTDFCQSDKGKLIHLLHASTLKWQGNDKDINQEIRPISLNGLETWGRPAVTVFTKRGEEGI